MTADESDYRNLLMFDNQLQYLKTDFERQSKIETSPDTNHSNALNYGNLALLFHERDTHWKQGGTAEALHYIDLALNYSTDPFDLVSQSSKLRNSLTLHKGLLLSELGYRYEAVELFDGLLSRSEAHVSQAGSQTVADDLDVLEDRDVSSVLYHKGDALLTLFNDAQGAAVFFQQAIERYPCNYNAYLKVVMALRSQNTLSQAEWRQWVRRLEGALLSIEQVSPDSIVFVDRGDVADDNSSGDEEDGGADGQSESDPSSQVVCRFEAQDLATSISSLNNIVSLAIVQASFYSAMYTAAEAAGDISQAWQYLQQARHLDRLMVDSTNSYSLERSIKQAAHITGYFKQGYWPPPHLATRDGSRGGDDGLRGG